MTITDYGQLVVFRDTTDTTIFKDTVKDIFPDGDYVYIYFTSSIQKPLQFDPNTTFTSAANVQLTTYSRDFRILYSSVTSPQTFASAQDLADYIYDLFATTPRTEYIIVAASDKDTELTTGFARYWPAPYDLRLLEVILDVDTDYVPTGSALIGDVEIDGSSIFSTRPQIEANESSSRTGVEGVIATTSVSEGTQLKLYLDQVGSTFGGAGIVFTFKVQRV